MGESLETISREVGERGGGDQSVRKKVALDGDRLIRLGIIFCNEQGAILEWIMF